MIRGKYSQTLSRRPMKGYKKDPSVDAIIKHIYEGKKGGEIAKMYNVSRALIVFRLEEWGLSYRTLKKMIKKKV